MKYLFAILTSLLVLSACGDGPAGRVNDVTTAPDVSTASYQPDPAPFDESADARADLRKAFSAARSRNKLVMIILGGNWCPDCHALSGMMDIPEMAEYLDANYEIVKVNVGRYDQNTDIPAEYGLEEWEGAPTIMILTAEGTLLNRSEPSALRSARSLQPQAVMEYFHKYAAM